MRSLFITFLLCLSLNAVAVEVIVKNEKGENLKEAQVMIVLKKGGCLKAEWSDGKFLADPMGGMDRILAASVGHEGNVKKVSSNSAGSVEITLKSSSEVNSIIAEKEWSAFPGIEGNFYAMVDNLERRYIYFKGLTLMDGRKPMSSPAKIELRRKLDATTPDGRDFELWVIDVTIHCSLIDYTVPK